MSKSEEPEDVFVMVLVLQKALIRSLSSSSMYQEVNATIQCMNDWAESLMNGGDIDMNAEHWHTVIGASK